MSTQLHSQASSSGLHSAIQRTLDNALKMSGYLIYIHTYIHTYIIYITFYLTIHRRVNLIYILLLIYITFCT